MHFSPRVCLTKGRPTFPRVCLEFHIVKMLLINVCFPHKIAQNCNETRRFLHTLDSILKGTIKVKVPFQDPKVRFLCCYKHLLAWKKSTFDDSEILDHVRCINILLIVGINYDKLMYIYIYIWIHYPSFLDFLHQDDLMTLRWANQQGMQQLSKPRLEGWKVQPAVRHPHVSKSEFHGIILWITLHHIIISWWWCIIIISSTTNVLSAISVGEFQQHLCSCLRTAQKTSRFIASSSATACLQGSLCQRSNAKLVSHSTAKSVRTEFRLQEW